MRSDAATGDDFRAALLRAGIIPDDDGGSGLGHDLDRALLIGSRAWFCHFEYAVDRAERDGDACSGNSVSVVADIDG